MPDDEPQATTEFLTALQEFSESSRRAADAFVVLGMEIGTDWDEEGDSA